MKTLTIALLGCLAASLIGCRYDPPRKIKYRSPVQTPVVIQQPATNVTPLSPEE